MLRFSNFSVIQLIRENDFLCKTFSALFVCAASFSLLFLSPPPYPRSSYRIKCIAAAAATVRVQRLTRTSHNVLWEKAYLIVTVCQVYKHRQQAEKQRTLVACLPSTFGNTETRVRYSPFYRSFSFNDAKVQFEYFRIIWCRAEICKRGESFLYV